MDPYSVSYKQGQESYIPKRVKEGDDRFCQCGMLKSNNADTVGINFDNQPGLNCVAH